MALVKFGGGIVDMRGSIGGSVFSKNRYGQYVRAKVVPVNPRSNAQSAIRSIMASVTEAWSRAVSATERTAWDVYAAAITMVNGLGESITLTGFNHYVRSNVARLNIGLPRIDVAPTTLSLPAQDEEFAITASSSAQNISVSFNESSPWATETSARMILHQGLPQLVSRAFFNGHFRTIGSISGSDSSAPTSPQTISVDFPIAEDQRQYVKARILRADGRLSEFFRDDAVVGA